LARALTCKPSVLLLDEPLSSLDPQFREDVRRTLADLHTSAGTTFLMVTHDFVDALTLADRAAVIRNGRLEQVDEVRNIFHRPATTFTARFVGMKNIFSTVYKRGECQLASIRMAMPDNCPVRKRGYAALRPEDVSVSLNGDSNKNLAQLSGVVQRIFRTGFSWAAEVACGENSFTACMEHAQALDSKVQPGAQVTLCFDPSKLHHIPEEND
ncbi:MAG: ABC transporter ATP-binding protein, partial [Pseudodesulfovibrio sp.]|nr:ABC transporter ATP-binding protein [Pseudodesulfovibrio sp.]